ncbi:MAG: porin family protein [Acidobacteriia bacterium]|nr:porin family protein [Terriglobia bacterium]
MKKLLGLSALLLVASLPAMAQVSTPRIEVGGGYTFRSFAFPPAFNDAGGVVNFPRVNMNGWDVNAAFNVTNWLAIAGDVDGTRNSSPDSFEPTVNDTTWVYTVMGGPRVYPFGHHKITPFAQVLLGHGYLTIYIPPAAGGPFTLSDGSFAFSAGGGVDASLGHHFAIRLVEFDYERTAFTAIASPGLSDANNNFKVKVGAVIRF